MLFSYFRLYLFAGCIVMLDEQEKYSNYISVLCYHKKDLNVILNKKLIFIWMSCLILRWSVTCLDSELLEIEYINYSSIIQVVLEFIARYC